MYCVVVSDDEEAVAAVRRAQDNGLRLACVSNTGLPSGKARMTFLPAEVFTDRTDQPLGIIREPKI